MFNIGQNWGMPNGIDASNDMSLGICCMGWYGSKHQPTVIIKASAASTCLAIISAQQRCQFCETPEPTPAKFYLKQSNTQCSMGEGDLHNIAFTE